MDNLTEPERKPYRGKAIRAVTNSPFFLEDRDQSQQNTPAQQPVAAGKVIQIGGLKVKTIDKCLPLNAIDEEFDSDAQDSSTVYEDTSEDDDIFDDNDSEDIEKEESAESEKKEISTESDTSTSDDEGDEPLKEEVPIDTETIQEESEVRRHELLEEEELINKEEEQEKTNEMKANETLVQGEDNQETDDSDDVKENEPVSDSEKPSTSGQGQKRPAENPEPYRFLTVKSPRFDTLFLFGEETNQSPFGTSDMFYPGTPAVLKNCYETGEKLKIIHRNKRGTKSMLHGKLLGYDKNWKLTLTEVVQVWNRRDKDQLNDYYLPEPIGKRYFCGWSGVIETYLGGGMWKCERQLYTIQIEGKQVVMANTTKR